MRGDHGSSETVREQAKLGPEQAHDRVQAATDPRHGGTQQPQGGNPLGCHQPHLDRDAAAHRVADDICARDLQLIHQAQHQRREPGCVVAAECGLGRRSKTGEIREVNAVLGGQRCGRLEQRCSRASQAMEEQHVRPRSHGQRRDPVTIDRDLLNRHHGGPAVGQAEQPLEGNRVVEVASDAEQAAFKRLNPRELSLPQRQPGSRVGGDRNVRLAARGATMDVGGGVTTHLPDVTHVS